MRPLPCENTLNTAVQRRRFRALGRARTLLPCLLAVIGANAATPAAATPLELWLVGESAADHTSAIEEHVPYRRMAKQTAHVTHVCRRIELEARKHRLPVGFFVRLIWTESRFDSDAISPKGARGIAQFMPGTAKKRGLADPFDPKTSIAASAHYLAELRSEFGNLGLAAAAYNAGESRARSFQDGNSSLPNETEDYVFAITGYTSDKWKTDAGPDADFGWVFDFDHPREL